MDAILTVAAEVPLTVNLVTILARHVPADPLAMGVGLRIDMVSTFPASSEPRP
jgi:hypothetical protein